MTADLKPNAFKWMKEIPPRQRRAVEGYLFEIRSHCPSNNFYNHSETISMLIALYHFDIHEKWLCGGSAAVLLNKTGSEAIIALQGVTSSDTGIVYGSNTINPNLAAIYEWKVRVFYNTDKGFPKIGLVEIPREIKRIRDSADHLKMKNGVRWTKDGQVVGYSDKFVGMTCDWKCESGELISITVNTKWRIVSLENLVGGDEKRKKDIRKWKMVLALGGKHTDYQYGDDDVDLTDPVLMQLEALRGFVTTLHDWLTKHFDSSQVRLAIDVPVGSLVVLEAFDVELLDVC